MSSRIESPWGSLGGRVAATAAADERRQAEAPVPDRMAESWLADGSMPEGGEERPVEHGRWVECRFDHALASCVVDRVAPREPER